MSDIPQSLRDKILAVPPGGTLRITLAEARTLMIKFPSYDGYAIGEELLLHNRCSIMGSHLVFVPRKERVKK